jgi:response regulator of citrate/malate metabolism
MQKKVSSRHLYVLHHAVTLVLALNHHLQCSTVQDVTARYITVENVTVRYGTTQCSTQCSAAQRSVRKYKNQCKNKRPLQERVSYF